MSIEPIRHERDGRDADRSAGRRGDPEGRGEERQHARHGGGGSAREREVKGRPQPATQGAGSASDAIAKPIRQALTISPA